MLGSASAEDGTGAWDRILQEETDGETGSNETSSYVEVAWSTFRRGLDLTGMTASELDKGQHFVGFERRLYDLALAVSARVEFSDNPRYLLEALAEEVFRQRSYQVRADRLFFALPKLSTPREMTAPALGLVLLAVAELVRPGVTLRYVHWPDAAALRYRQGDYVLNLLVAPGSEGEFLSAVALKERFLITDQQERDGVYLTELAVEQLGGLILNEFGQGALEIDRQDIAVKLFREAKGADAASSAPALALASVAFENRDFQAALGYTDDALRHNPNDFATLELHARLLRSTAQIGAARELYSRLLREFPNRAHGVHVGVAALEADAGNWEQAVRHLREAAVNESRPEERQRLLERATDLEVYPDLDTIRVRQAGEVDTGDPAEPGYPARFAALRRVAQHPIPAAYETLIDALEDPNQRFARMAWKTLERMSGQNLPFDRAAWKTWWTESGSGDQER